jgi:gliding motility-associated-like protein
MAKHLFHACLIIAIFQCCLFSPSYCCSSTGAKAYLLHANSTNAVKTASPTITESGSPSAVNTSYGTASASTSFTVSGSNMTAGILVSPTTGFEVSTDNITFSNSVTVGSAGTIPNTTVYLRLATTAGAGGHSGNITLTSAGAATVNVAEANSIVSPAVLTVTATDVDKMYGTTLTGGSGSANFTAAGLQNGETIGSVSIGYGTGAQPTDAVANYSSCVAIANATGGTFSAANYNITYISGNINVTLAPLSIIANNVTKTYGVTLTGGPGSTAFTAVGLQNGETIGSVTIGYGTGAAATDPAGIYDESVTVAAGTGGNFSGHNYTITHVPGNITVMLAPLTITANDVTKTYGTVLTDGSGSTAFTVTGLQNGETIGSVSIGYGTAGVADALPGTCDACVSVANATGGTFDPNNYNITYVPGNINVIPAPLTITADNLIKLYGEPNPVLTVTYSGFVNGEGPGQLTTLPIVTTTASTTSPPGQYPITADGASDPNYTITYVPGILTITQSYNIPNTFTPNGDGVNDTWHIQFLDAYQNCTISIFNRLGQNVYSSIGYGIPWNGTYHGSALPSGAYYYIIDLKNINRVLSGYVTIIR